MTSSRSLTNNESAVDDTPLDVSAYRLCRRAVQRAKRIANRGLQRVFPSLKEMPSPAQKLTRHSLAEIAARLEIDLILDVGANIGQTGRNLRAAGYKDRIVSFEPQRVPFQQLFEASKGDEGWKCIQLALGRTAGCAEMEVSGWNACSSLLPMETKHIEMWPGSKPIGTERVKSDTLDNLVNELQLDKHRTMLKIDVQGYEMEVLAGGVTTLSMVHAAKVELLFSPLYKNQSPYYEVMRALEHAGLRCVGLFDSFHDPRSGYVLFGDGLFVR